MSGDMENYYIKRTQIDENNFGSIYSVQEIDNKLINTADIYNIYYDTILYLHLYNSLYLALLKFNDNNFNNITKFKNIIDNLDIIIDNTIIVSVNGDDVGTLIEPSGGSSRYVFTFYVLKAAAIYSIVPGMNAITGDAVAANYNKDTPALVIPLDLTHIYKYTGSPLTPTLISDNRDYESAVSTYLQLATKTDGSYNQVINFPSSASDIYYIYNGDISNIGTATSAQYIKAIGVDAVKEQLKKFIYFSITKSLVSNYPSTSEFEAQIKYVIKDAINTVIKSKSSYGTDNDLQNGLLKRVFTDNTANAGIATTFPTSGSLTLYVLTSDLNSDGIPVGTRIYSDVKNNVSDLKAALAPYIYEGTTRLSSYPTSFSNKNYYVHYSYDYHYSQTIYGTLDDLNSALLNRIFTQTADSYTAHKPSWTMSSTYTPARAGTIASTIFSPNRNSHYNSYVYSGSSIANTKYTMHLPILTNTLSQTYASGTIVDIVGTPILYNITFNKSYFNTRPYTISNEIDISYDNSYRQNRLLNTIKEILNTTSENMMGFLLYNKIIYNIVLNNLEIQFTIRSNYLNKITSQNMDSVDYIKTNAGAIITPVNSLITNMTNNIISLKNNLFTQQENDYIKNKYKYTNKIEALDKIKADYNKIQNTLNISVKEYNKYIDNFTSIKKYANYIIIFLIILIIITILITILTNITPQFKNSYYIITFIILLIITYLFYSRFNHVNLYEKFALPAMTNSGSFVYLPSKSNNKLNHYYFCNAIADNITLYNNTKKTLINELRNNIYTVGNKTFSAGADDYLYKLYMEKKNLNEVNRLKKVSLTNLIESMKKQILYLFNIILLLSCLTIILLLGLMLHSTYPFLITYIIILCSILVVIIVIYFIIAIIQPTRMIASKNYWANNRPTETILNKL